MNLTFNTHTEFETFQRNKRVWEPNIDNLRRKTAEIRTFADESKKKICYAATYACPDMDIEKKTNWTQLLSLKA